MKQGDKQLIKEIQEIKSKIEKIANDRINVEDGATNEDSIKVLMRSMIEERERTNRMIAGMLEKIADLEKRLESATDAPEASTEYEVREGISNKEIPLSSLDAKILELVQTKGMVCAEDIQKEMNYKGKNAACARLNKLHKEGMLDKIQLGHKVYYRYDAGKATNTLIISPPQ